MSKPLAGAKPIESTRKQVTPVRIVPIVVAVALVLSGCGAGNSDTATEPAADEQGETPTTETFDESASEAPADDKEECWSPVEMLDPGQIPDAGFEIIEHRDDGTLRAWLSLKITLDEFDALELPDGWLKNQPRGGGGDGQGGPDKGVFCGSPGSNDGEMAIRKHFGHEWAHVATIVETGVPLDKKGLLTGAMVEKEHEITYDAGTAIPLLVSPKDEIYPLVSRDARRSTDESPIPKGWKVVEHTFTEDYTTRLPNPILNIRVENQDSYQGPVTGIEI